MLEVVSEKTGYPAEVLDLDMQLDADLGIDSIKRVEILSALQDRLPSLPSISPELLGTLRSLRSIVEQIGGASQMREQSDSIPDSGRRAASRFRRSPRSLVCCSRRSPTRRAIPPRCSSSTCGWMRTSASIRSSGSRSSRPFRIGCPVLAPPGPRRSARSARCGDIVVVSGPACVETAPNRKPPSATAARPSPQPWSTMARVLLESVAEKTGFPIDMLELDMQLDVDLGIDSIKRVEILSAVQERLPEARAIGPEQVGTLRTVRQIAEFLSASTASKPVQFRSKLARRQRIVHQHRCRLDRITTSKWSAVLERCHAGESSETDERCRGCESDRAAHALSAGASARTIRIGATRCRLRAGRDGVDHR